ncbi:MAG: GWxTD domain-containing protein [Acidobacteriota bacterium]
MKNDSLSERYRKWLEEEVVYIISPVEREVFLKLKTDRERDLFIDAFWKQRDPTPATPDNEFKNEHFRRINYANHFFGRGTPKPGWRTDRGRVYIILGEPNDVQRFEGKTQVYPTEIWFYQGKTNVGLPPGFHLVFFQQGGIGEYRLYSPLNDGPQALLTSYWGDPMDYQAAYENLREFEPDLAEVSLNLIPGERSTVGGRPSMSSDLLIQRVETTPIREIEEKYARKFLEYKDIVEVEYSTNYIDSESLIKILQSPSGMTFIHYAIEPERLSVNQYEDKYYTTLKVNGSVTNSEGKAIYQFEREINLEFNKEQMSQISRRPLSIRDMFPLIPGEYSLSILLKNEVSKEFTSLEKNIYIPEEETDIQISPLILAYNSEIKPVPDRRLRPFQIGVHNLYIQANRVFLNSDTLHIAFQLFGLTQELRERGVVSFDFFKGEEKYRSIQRNLKELPVSEGIVESFSLQDFIPAHYRIKVSLLNGERELVFENEQFVITHLENIARPWIYSKLLPAEQDPVYSYTLGAQYFLSGQMDKARKKLEKAYESNPGSVENAVTLSRLYMELNEYKKIDSLLSSFFDEDEAPPYEAHFILGKAKQALGKYGEAIDIFDKAIERFGLNSNLLNAVGECYFSLGKVKEAAVAWQRSLELNPNQPEIKRKLEEAKEK